MCQLYKPCPTSQFLSVVHTRITLSNVGLLDQTLLSQYMLKWSTVIVFIVDLLQDTHWLGRLAGSDVGAEQWCFPLPNPWGSQSMRKNARGLRHISLSLYYSCLFFPLSALARLASVRIPVGTIQCLSMHQVSPLLSGLRMRGTCYILLSL